jgi:transposase-like protein
MEDPSANVGRYAPAWRGPLSLPRSRYEKSRQGGAVRDITVFSARGVDAHGRRRILGVFTALSEAKIHWREFLESLVERGLRWAEFITSDDHPGLKTARRAVPGGATWQKYQFHLAQNAVHNAPTLAIRKRMRTSNPIERAIQQELKRRAVKVRVFPDNDVLLHLVPAILVEIDETWQASSQSCINRNNADA